MPRLLLQHVRHAIRRGPHALANLTLAGQAVLQSQGDVAGLITGDPRLALHVRLAHHGSGAHRGVDLVASAIEEAGVDEHKPVRDLVHAGGEIGRGAALLVHQPDLQRPAIKTQEVLDPLENFVGQPGLVGAVHLGFDDVDRPVAFLRSAVAEPPLPQNVDRTDAGRDQCVQHPLGRLRSVGQENCRRRHQMSDVAHEQQGASRQGQARAVRRRVFTIRRQRPRQGLSALDEGLAEIAAHQAQPVAIAGDLVGCVDRRDRVLQIDDGRQGGLQNHIRQTGRVHGADGAGAVDDQFDVQAVVLQQDRLGSIRCAPPAGQLTGLSERRRQAPVRDHIGLRVCVTARRQRHGFVEEGGGAGDDPRAPAGVIGSRRRQVAQRVCAVQGVIQAAPTRIGGVQDEAGVQRRHHQLRPGHGRDLVVDIAGPDLKLRRFGLQIADAAQEGGGGLRVLRTALARNMPLVDLRLQPVAFRQHGAAAVRAIIQQACGILPEALDVQADDRQHLLLKEGGQLRGDLQTRARRHRHQGVS